MTETNLAELEAIAMEIGNKLDATVQKKIDKRGISDHADWNWASEIHHPCKRFLVYSRLDYKDRKPVSVTSQVRFDEGDDQEDKIRDMFSHSKLKIVLGQLTTKWEKYQLKGKVDGFFELDHRKFPIEITSTQPWYWHSTRTIEQIKNHTKFWIRKKASQLNLYFLLEGYEGGFLIIKTFGKKPRILPMTLDLELAEEDIKTCEIVNEHVAARTYPDGIPYQSDVCGLCDFEHLSMPMQFTPIDSIDPADYADMLRYCELEPTADEFKQLGKRLIGSKSKPGKYFGKNLIHQDVEVNSTKYPMTVSRIPKDIRAQFSEKTTATRTEINYVGGE